MSNGQDGQDTASPIEEQKEAVPHIIVKPRHVGVVIREADNHYLASFNHSPNRVFHGMQELLDAIKAEVRKISHPSTSRP